MLAIAAASALTSGMAHALGLGDIALKSSLNQPLEAEIELLEVRDLGNGEVIPSLAPVEEFSKVGVDRPFFLTDLKFTPILKPNGKSVIRVTSSKPVREPYLNFLVEVLWPNGRLLREYTVLLDPPLYSPQTVAAAAPRLPQAAPVAPRVSTSAPISRPQPVTSRAEAPASAPSRIEGNEYRTDRDDTLWEVASRVRPSGAVSVHQTMLAIQDLNPNAFLDGNINRLKSGQVLRLPNDEQIRTRSQADALAQVAAQNSAWREGRAVQPVAASRQLDATRRSEAGNAPAQAASEDNLRLVSAAAGKSTNGSDNGAAGNSKALADKLALNQESLATTQRENQELKERLTDLQSQLDKLQRLIELKNEQLAKLQGGLAAEPAAEAAGAPAAAESKPLETAAAPAPAVAPTNGQPGEPAPAVSAEAVTPAAQPEPAAPVAAPAPVAEAAKPAAPKPAAPKPVAVKPAPAPVYEPSLVDEIMANPLLLAAGGGGLALLAGLGLMINSRRKSLKAAAADEQASGLFQDLEPQADPSVGDTPATAPAPARAGEPKSGPMKSDPLAEAEMYVTYGRFSQAAELLRNALNDEPQRADLRLKLMEVYAEMGDREGFSRQETELGEIGGAQPQIDQLRARYPQILAAAGGVGAGAALGASVADFGLDEVPEVLAESVAAADEFSFDSMALESEPEEAPLAAAAGGQGDDFDLSLDDLEAELERELAANRDTSDALPLDELTLDGLGDELATLEVDAGLGEAEGFDLELEATASPAAAAEDDFSFDLEEPLLQAGNEAAVPQTDDDLLAELDQLSLEEAPAALPEADGDDFLLELADVDLAAASPEPELAALPEMDELERELQALGGTSDASAAELDLDAAFDEFLAQADLTTEPVPSAPAPVAAVAAVAAAPVVADELPSLDELDIEAAPALTGNEDFNFLADTDETATKLDLARAYIDMGDAEGARDILDEVLKEGNSSQQQEAREMMGRIA
ncbi:FimV/HubP family polar landmark protein [Pseudomonas sp. GCM10022188]|uniref:FimV/HubP family polar landmark protein n=1 Tax=Pseudomonas TaxID=286 RepID=UPI0029E7F812|nr:FimV/HubP family polar landmark protein [Pseudomonas oryzagri]